VGLEQELQVK